MRAPPWQTAQYPARSGRDSPPKKQKTNEIENPFILSQELKNIDGPEIQNDYIYTRETKDKWTSTETEQWFTEPTQKEIDSLKKSNEKIISDILGVAP